MLKDKVAFVSGGTGYIGSEVCRSLSEYGAKVIFSYNKNQKKANELTGEIEGARAIPINLRDVNDIQKKIEKLYKDIDIIDLLVNSAAISHIMPLAMLEEEDVDLILDINIKGNIFLTKSILKGMIRNRSGTIINIGSIAGHRMFDVPLTYAVTKAAISGFTYALASELKRFGIRVNSVVPGLLESGVSNGVPEDLRDDFIRHCAAGRAGKAREIADTICFLASDKASYINGQNIFVDGGI
jgi:3-oxoacyl-[acyl-carrier protein] reductase